MNAAPKPDTRPDVDGASSSGEQRPAPTTKHGLGTRIGKHARVLRWAGLFLLVVALVASLTWAIHVNHQAGAASQQADDERQRARQAENQAKEERRQAEAARQQAAKERAEARAEVAAARRTTENDKAVLAFLQDKLLSAGRSAVWTEGHWADPPGKEITLREAVDAAAHAVAKTLVDRPLVETEVREVLGSAYLDLGEAALAVAQYERALPLREAVLGPDNPATVACRNKLARALRLAGHPAEAARLYERKDEAVKRHQELEKAK